MKLGDIFAKLSEVELYAIVRWYGKAFYYLMLALSIVFILSLVLFIIIMFFSAVPWWGIVMTAIFISGVISYNLTKDENNETW